jgi:hypothetical protein
MAERAVTPKFPKSLSRTRLAGLLVAIPAIVGACTLTVLEAGLWRLSSAAAGQAPMDTFGGAIRRGDLDETWLFVRGGQDPNAPTGFRDPYLTGGRGVTVSPLLIAVASNNDDAVMMLLSGGARFDAPANRFAACLADRLGHDGVAELIAEYGGAAASPDDCPDAPVDPAAPLVAFASAAPQGAIRPSAAPRSPGSAGSAAPARARPAIRRPA